MTLITDLTSELNHILGAANMSSTHAERDLHSHDESDEPAVLPDVVVWPANTREVSAVAQLANRFSIPITPWGASTSTEGHTVPVGRGIVMDFRRMDAVIEVRPGDFQAEVEPGVLRLDLEKKLIPHGLFFPPDPGANASVGGMIANNAAGIRAVKYGATSANVLGLEAVLADGTVVNTGSRSVKQSAGYDLTGLIVGSEGTLAIVTRATLKLAPVPTHFSTAMVAFPGINEAAEAVQSIVGYGLAPAALELMHRDHLAWMNEEHGANHPIEPTLLMEFTGASEAAVAEAMDTAVELSNDAGASAVEVGLGHEHRARLWRFRHGQRERLRRRFPNQHWISMDASVPISQFTTLIDFVESRGDELGLTGRVGGHAGDGNIHMGLHYSTDDEVARQQCQDFGSEIVSKAIGLGGTCSGEHGIGLGKRKYMLEEHGTSGIALMRTIKQAMDPSGILNPGKVLPDE